MGIIIIVCFEFSYKSKKGITTFLKHKLKPNLHFYAIIVGN